MNQFVAYQNRGASRTLYPLLLNVQSDLTSTTETLLTVPLYPLGKKRNPAIERAAPVIDVDGVAHVVMMPLIAGVNPSQFGKAVVDLSHERSIILDALDFLTHGI